MQIDTLLFLDRRNPKNNLYYNGVQFSGSCINVSCNESLSQKKYVCRTRQHFVCSAKTVTTTPGKLGRAVGFYTRTSRAGAGFQTVL